MTGSVPRVPGAGLLCGRRSMDIAMLAPGLLRASLLCLASCSCVTQAHAVNVEHQHQQHYQHYQHYQQQQQQQQQQHRGRLLRAWRSLPANVTVTAGNTSRAISNPKRGFVADARNGTCADPSLLSTSSWYYDYNMYDPYRHHLNCSTGGPQEFVPMHWCWSHGTPPVYTPGPPYLTNDSVHHFLGYNEVNAPNQCGGGKASPARAAAAWGPMATQLHQSYRKAQLVSPATAALTRGGAETITWLRNFFGNCSELYGPTGCGIESIAVHYYGCNATETMWYLRSVFEAFRQPIWLTEFSCGHAPQVSTHAAYLRELLPQLDAAVFVQRYAWMSARAKGSGSARALLMPGQAKLTELGKLYNSL